MKEVQKTINEIEADIAYFEKLDFQILASKFTRDLNLIKKLLEKIPTVS